MKKLFRHVKIAIEMMSSTSGIASEHYHSNANHSHVNKKVAKKVVEKVKKAKKTKHKIDKASPKETTYVVKKSKHHTNNNETGMASWYGNKFLGRKTASGERFTSNKFTAAHKNLPMGTVVKVTNLGTDSEVIVRINDRGPYIKGRILDLSPAAAKLIGLTNTGVAKVKMEIISYPSKIST